MSNVPFTANARALGGRQTDKLQNITGNISARSLASGNGNALTLPLGAFVGASVSTSPGSTISEAQTTTTVATYAFDASRVARTGTETRPLNTAYLPRIHV